MLRVYIKKKGDAMTNLKKLALLLTVGTIFTGCSSVEHNLLQANSLLLSSKEVRDIFQGNTVASTTGESFYWDASGKVVGKGSEGGILRGNWNITDDGRLCVSNLNSSMETGGCYKVYFDNSTQQRKLIDADGNLKYTVMNVVTGNPNNF